MSCQFEGNHPLLIESGTALMGRDCKQASLLFIDLEHLRIDLNHLKARAVLLHVNSKESIDAFSA